MTAAAGRNVNRGGGGEGTEAGSAAPTCRFRTIFDLAPVGIAEVGLDGRWLLFNHFLCDILKYPPQELERLSLMEVSHPDDVDGHLEKIRRILSGRGESYTAEGRYLRKGGYVVWLDLAVALVRGPDGSPSHFIAVAQDASPRRAALEAEAGERHRIQNALREKEVLLLQQSRLAALGEMVGNIAHQWRQPLNILGLLAQDLQLTFARGELTEGFVDDYVARTMETIIHMSKTVDDFRSFFLPDREKVRFRVREVVERTLSLLEGSLRARQIRTEVVGGEETEVLGYPGELCQVLLNILNNARDAFSSGASEIPLIRIEIGYREGRTFISVTDNAGGVPEGIMGRIFEPYFTTKPPEEGTGVGLYMSKVIVEGKMKGTLTARNVAGGACFTIEI